MPTPACSAEAARFAFSSQPGLDLARKTLEGLLPYTPHDYQLEGVCKLLDGLDLIAVLATGSGKTGYYLMYMLMLRELSKNPHLCDPPYTEAPQDPCVVMVYPTNGLEEEQALSFSAAGLATVVINSDTLETSRKRGVDLWLVARSSVNVILLSPEQLTSPRFDTLLRQPAFQARVCAMGIDEVHLLYSWGQNFRKSYQQLGHARARFPTRTRIIGTTATLLAGHPTQSVLSFLGLRMHQLHFLRRSNVRAGIETRFRVLTHGMGGWVFPDLRWILREGRKTVIHCRTIALSFRVAVYLWRLLPPASDRTKRLRLYNALNRQSYNAETRRLMQYDPDTQIIIATASFMVGLDLPNIKDVVVVGNLANADEHVQWQGRAGRDPSVVRDARFITYVTKKAMQTARALCDGKTPRAEKQRSGKKSAMVHMELSMARLLLARCVTAMQNVLYDNPVHDPPCSCRRCSPLGTNTSTIHGDHSSSPHVAFCASTATALCSGTPMSDAHAAVPSLDPITPATPCAFPPLPAISSAADASCRKCSGCVSEPAAPIQNHLQSTSYQIDCHLLSIMVGNGD
ncbi:P-loop containing nucleoside triphosphate hydrolase protein [Trametes cingulata]|nr:P-loop containing nucleoside triphosphate hydrolase protein [Trametes cingulata]